MYIIYHGSWVVPDGPIPCGFIEPIHWYHRTTRSSRVVQGFNLQRKKNRWFLVICSSNRTSDPLNQLIIGWFNRSYKHSTTMVVIQFVSLVNITKLPGQLGFPETYGRIDWVKPTNTIAVEYSLGIHQTIALITINIHKPGASRF